MIDLYTAPTPNGHKASCTLEELGLEYTVKVVDIRSGDQHTPIVQFEARVGGHQRCGGRMPRNSQSPPMAVDTTSSELVG